MFRFLFAIGFARGIGKADDFANAQAVGGLARAAAFAFDALQRILKLDVMLDGDVGHAAGADGHEGSRRTEVGSRQNASFTTAGCRHRAGQKNSFAPNEIVRFEKPNKRGFANPVASDARPASSMNGSTDE